MKSPTLVFSTALLASCILAFAASPDDTATALASAAGVKTGVCAIPFIGDGSLATAFAKKGFIVSASDPDPAKVTRVRVSLADSGLIGRSLYLEKARPGRLALADRSVDLAVLIVAGPADLQTVAPDEFFRVLAPFNGTAIIGPLTPATEPAIKAWAAKLPGATTREAAGARWIVARRGPLEGAVSWSHWFCNPDNNPVTTDTAFDGPTDVSWLGKPYNYPRHVGCRVAANGRVFVAIGAADYEGTHSPDTLNQIVARSIFNGSVLWRRPLDPKNRVLKSAMIADGDLLWLADGPDILQLDAATGVEKARFPVGANGESSKWLAESDGILVALVGADDPKDDGSMADGRNMAKWATERTLGYGRKFVALDAKTGKSIWQHEEPNPVAGRTVAVRKGQLFFLVPGQRLACADLKTGKPVWENKDADMLAGNDEQVKDLGGVTVVSIEERPALMVTENAVYLGQSDAMNFYCFALKDGARLWSLKRHGGRAFNFLATDEKLFLAGTEPNGVLDPLTGKKETKQPPRMGSGCGVFTASAHALLGQVGGASVSLPEMKDNGSLPIKTQCQLGTFVADGSLLAVPASCRCTVARGFLALTKSSGTSAKIEPGEQFSADLKKIASLPVTASDWPTHRGNNNRTGSSPVNAPATAPREIWAFNNPVPLVSPTNQTPSPAPEAADFKPLPPVSAGGFIFLAAEDGSIRCLDAARGSVKWTAWTDGPIFATPTVADGRLFAGSADGRVYAFEAATGRPLWRAPLAPSTDKVMVYGHLQSRWPVNSGVLVQDGVVYAAAGMLLQQGLRVAALDAVTGAQKWLNSDSLWKEGKVWEMPAEIFPAGYMTVFGGKLWVRSFQGGGGGAAFDLATGALQPKVPVGGLRGCEIGVIKDRALLYGGRDLYTGHVERVMGRGNNFAFLSFGPDGKPVLPDMSNFASSGLTPAWNDAFFLTAGTRGGYGDLNLECWDIDKALGSMSEKAATLGFEKMPSWRKNQMPEPRPASEIENPPYRAWGPVKSVFVSILIANKTAVAVWSPVDKQASEKPSGAWKLSAHNLQDGASLWQVDLPSAPARDGLCIDRNGRVIVSFDDGSSRCYGL